MQEVAAAIKEGALAFLNRQYRTIGLLAIVVALVPFLTSKDGWYTAIALVGLVMSLLFVWITQHYTETNHRPVRGIAQASISGHATNIISGIAVAAVDGDKEGDPFKDIAGPSLHVLIKLLATITLVLAKLLV